MDPIKRLVLAAPTPGILWTSPLPGPGGAPAYSNDSVYQGEPHRQYPVLGVFSNAVDRELDGSAQAIFTIHVDDMPPDVKPDFSRCRVDDTDYVIEKVRKRFWMGRLNGYTFALQL